MEKQEVQIETQGKELTDMKKKLDSVFAMLESEMMGEGEEVHDPKGEGLRVLATALNGIETK